MTILEKIFQYKKLELEERKKKRSLQDIQKQITDTKSDKNSLFKKLQNDSSFHFICEVKKASPSKGIIQPDFDPVKYAKCYQDGGATAISVLTDEHFFQGHLDYLTKIKNIVNIPVLRKDFIFDEYQIFEAKLARADIILLIAKILDRDAIQNLTNLALELGMDVLFEIANRDEIKKIPVNLPVIVGINNRNLENFTLDLRRSIQLGQLLPPHLPRIAESGIQSVTDCQKLFQAGFNGALIGELFMRSPDPRSLIRQYVREVNHAHSA